MTIYLILNQLCTPLVSRVILKISKILKIIYFHFLYFIYIYLFIPLLYIYMYNLFLSFMLIFLID